MDYLWIYILAGIAIVSLLAFLITFSRDMFLTKKLKLNKLSLLLNFSLLVISLSSVGLIINLFLTLREQISLLS